MLVDGLHTLRPLSGRGVGAQQNKKCCNRDDQDTGDDKGYPPCHVLGKSLLGNERVVDSWHGEICDTASSVAKASSDGVGGTNDVLVEEACRPHLTWHKATTKDADEESQRI